MSSTAVAVHDRREATKTERTQRLRTESFPRRGWIRWSLRALFSLPYVAIALINNLAGTAIGATPNATLVAGAGGIHWGAVDVAWLEQLYPPVTTILVALIPGGRLGLGIVGGIAGGVLLVRLLEIMVQRRYPTGTVVILLLAVGANPLFVYTATENFEGMLCLALFSVGLADMVRFVAWTDTRAGFRAGLLFMFAVLSSPAGFFYVAVAVLTAPFLRLGRKGQEGARSANVLILAYPTVSALLAFAFLEWAFLGRPFAFVGLLLEGGRPLADVLTILFTTFNGFLVIAPVLSAWLVALIVRKPGAILISTLVFFSVVASSVLGFLPVNSAGDTFLLMVIMAVALIPTARAIPTILLVDAVAILQIVIAWAAAFNRPIVVEWMNAFAAALGS